MQSVLGLDRQLQQARHVLDKRRAATLLFVGPRGVGKKTLCLTLAGCQDSTFLSLINTHKTLTPSQYLFFSLQPKIDDGNNLRRFLEKKTVKQAPRFVCLWEMDDVRHDVQNMLLKTLEEPPENTFFLMTCLRASSLLPTLRSRVHCVPVLPLTQQPFSKVYEAICSMCDVRDPPAQEILYKQSQGCIGRAVRFLRQTHETTTLQKGVQEETQMLLPEDWLTFVYILAHGFLPVSHPQFKPLFCISNQTFWEKVDLHWLQDAFQLWIWRMCMVRQKVLPSSEHVPEAYEKNIAMRFSVEGWHTVFQEFSAVVKDVLTFHLPRTSLFCFFQKLV